MINTMVNTIRLVRAFTMKTIKPQENYFFATRSLKPLSSKFGFDRGTPIDRYYIEKFLADNKDKIKGRCLEIGDNRYTKKYGVSKVKISDILDIDKKNKKANIHANLKNLKSLKSNLYDCIILTHVLGMIDDYEAAVRECKRILKPGGTILVTTSCLSPAHDINANFFRFTVASTRYVFGKYFNKKNLVVKSYGNVLAGQYFWVGLAQEELTKKELEFNDPNYPCVVALRASKSKGEVN